MNGLQIGDYVRRSFPMAPSLLAIYKITDLYGLEDNEEIIEYSLIAVKNSDGSWERYPGKEWTLSSLVNHETGKVVNPIVQIPNEELMEILLST